uniref:Ovule protein n=1 Tax=Caenorhabditis tropicalis TaxID=1561998 RepID=A0A1I7UVR6_9PELO
MMTVDVTSSRLSYRGKGVRLSKVIMWDEKWTLYLNYHHIPYGEAWKRRFTKNFYQLITTVTTDLYCKQSIKVSDKSKAKRVEFTCSTIPLDHVSRR